MSEDYESNDKNLNLPDYGNIPVVRISENSEEFLIPCKSDKVELKSDDLEQDIAARKIQAHWRSYQQQKLHSSSSQTEDIEFTDEQYLSALIIQNHYRNYLSKKQVRAREQNAAQVIQYHYRQHLKRSEEKFEADLREAAKIAQENYNRLQLDDEENVSASDDIQETEELPNLQSSDVDSINCNAAIVIQRKYREHLKERQEKIQSEKENKAAVSIQRQYRKHLKLQEDKHQFEKENSAATSIQRQYRKHKLKLKQEKNQIEKENNAATSIQRQFRKYYSERNTAALKIQNKFRNYQESKKSSSQISNVDRNELALPVSNSETISATEYPDNNDQREIAARKIQKHYRQHYNKRVSAATSIQQQFRSSKANSVLDIQTGNKIQNQVILNTSAEEEKAAVFIQKQHKAHLLRLSQENSLEILHANGSTDSKEISNESVINESPPYENLRVDSVQVYDEPSVDEITNDDAYYHDSEVNQPEQLATRVPDFNDNRSNRAVPPITKGKKMSNIHAKPGRKFDEIWPESKKSQHYKVKESPRKRQVQVSLDMKREQRRNDKNKRKDKFHLSNLRKQAQDPSSNQVDTTQTSQETGAKSRQGNGLRTNQAGGAKKRQETVGKKKQNVGVFKDTKKVNTPHNQQKEDLDDREPSEPELLQLRESTDEDSSPIDFHAVELEDTISEPLEEETHVVKPTVQVKTSKRNLSNPGANINIHHTRSSRNIDSVRDSHKTRGSQEMRSKRDRSFPQSKRGDKIARRWSDQSSLSSGGFSPIKVPLGSLDSYTVQNMLKRNDLLTRQKNDNHSYLQSYLKQMNLMNRPSGIATKKPKNTRQREVCAKRNQPEPLQTNNLEKIAKYGRNSQPENWKALLDNSLEGSPEPKGACRGNYYPVIPAYGKMKTNVSQKSSELSEIPWPSDIG